MMNEDTLQALEEAVTGRTIRCDSFEEYLELAESAHRLLEEEKRRGESAETGRLEELLESMEENA